MKINNFHHPRSEVLRPDHDHKAARQILERIEYLDRSSQTQKTAAPQDIGLG